MKKSDRIIIEERFLITDEVKRKKKFNELLVKVIKITEIEKIA